MCKKINHIKLECLFFHLNLLFTKIASKSWYWLGFWRWLISLCMTKILSLLLPSSILKTASLLWDISCTFGSVCIQIAINLGLGPQLELTERIAKQIYNYKAIIRLLVNSICKLLCLGSWRIWVKLEFNNISSGVGQSK